MSDKPAVLHNLETGSSHSSKDTGDEYLLSRASDERPGEHGNILAQYTEKQAMVMGRTYALEHDMDPTLFGKAAAVARNPAAYMTMDFLSIEEKYALHLEKTKKWHIPRKLVEVIALGSMAAAVQGMDQSVINGATLFYPTAMGITEMANADLMEGFINGAPYLCCSVVCWTSDYWNRKLGRRWVIFWSCFISAITCLWQGAVNLKWYHLFISRFALGLGVGVKSATAPAYAAETAPAKIRGSLVMLWQFFTAVGIMLGYATCLAFYYIGDHGIAGGLNWRLMLASAAIPAFFVLFQVPFVPESPRWLMGKEKHKEAYGSLRVLRYSEIEAARDCFYQYVLLKEEGSYGAKPYFSRIKEMFTIRRNRNGAVGAWIVMFMQQFCGINVIAYYSSSIFIESNLSEVMAMLASWGFGMLNFLFAIPAFYTIDTYGRRNLLLITFPLMSILLLMAACGFWIPFETNPHARLAVITTGIYLFACVYSSGEGPVPFTYSAEAFPLYIRDLGMGFATATCWFFNFILAFSWPRMKNAFKVQGAFGWYAAWNIIGFFLVLLFLPETKGLTLEELDEVFNVPLRKHAHYRTKELIYRVRKYVLRQNPISLPPLYAHQRRATEAGTVEWTEKPEALHEENI